MSILSLVASDRVLSLTLISVLVRSKDNRLTKILTGFPKKYPIVEFEIGSSENLSIELESLKYDFVITGAGLGIGIFPKWANASLLVYKIFIIYFMAFTRFNNNYFKTSIAFVL